jgi:polysaccharide pyruvyl transferase WcaK-like protein
VQPFFAAAVPRALLAALNAVAQDCKLSIVAIEPRFVNAGTAAARPERAHGSATCTTTC